MLPVHHSAWYDYDDDDDDDDDVNKVEDLLFLFYLVSWGGVRQHTWYFGH
jgi:hypothetical protein